MRSVFVFLCTLISFCAQAQSVGDKILYRYTDPVSGASKDILQRKIIIAAFENETFTIRDIYLKNEKIYSQFEYKYKKSEMPSSDLLKSYVTECESKWLGQKILLTTAAGKFETCQKKNSVGDQVWLGSVPVFGLLKEVSDEGIFEVESFEFF